MATPSITLQWENSSPWANPSPNDIYTLPVSLMEGDDKVDVEFFVSEMRLILKSVYYLHSGKEIIYHNMGKFVETVYKQGSIRDIKHYAQYVIDGYAARGNLLHCPTFEMMDDVDDNFNPL